MASEQQVDLLLDEIRELVKLLSLKNGGLGAKSGGSTTGGASADQTKKSFDELIRAIGLLAVRMEGKARTTRDEIRAVSEFAKKVEQASDAANKASQKRVEQETKIAEDQERNYQEEKRMAARRRAENLREQIQEIQQTKLASREAVEQIRSSGVDFGDVLKNNVGDKLVKFAGGGMFAATSLQVFTMAVGTAADSLATFSRGLLQGERGTNLTAKAMTKLATGISDITSLVSGVAAVAAFIGRFTPMGRAAMLATSGLSYLASMLAKTGAEINELASQQVQTVFETFKELSRMGATPIEGFKAIREGLQQGFMTIGADIKDFTRLIASNADDLKVFGKNLFDAGAQVIGLAGAIDKDRGQQLNAMGIFREDLQQAALTYMSIQSRTGQLQLSNTTLLRTQTEKLAFEMDTLASLTGKQKDEIAKGMRTKMAEERYRAALIEAREEAATGDPEAMAKLQRLENFGRMADILREFGIDQRGVLQYAAGGPGASMEARAAMQQFRLTDFEQMAGEGQVSQGNLIGFLQQAIKQSQNLRGVEKIIGKIPGLTTDIVNVDDMMRVFNRYDQEVQKGFKGTIDEYLREVQAGRRGDKETQDFIKSLRAQQTAAMVLEQGLADLMPAAKLSAEASTLFAEYVTKFGNAVDKIAGGVPKEFNKPASTPVPIPSRAEMESAKTLGGQAGSYMERLRKQQQQRAQQKSSAAATEQGKGAEATGAPGTKTGETNLTDIISFGTDSGDISSFNQLNPEFRQRVIDAATEYNKLTGQKLQINSAYRTYEKQKELYEKYLKGQGPLAADPDSEQGSKHMKGLAVDIQNYDSRYATLSLSNAGLKQPYPNDKVHFERMALGGIIDPTQGGTPVLAAEAGRAEAFVPLGAGKKIPVSFNFKEFSQAMKLKDIEFGVETKDTIEKTLNRYLGDFKSYGGAMESLKDLSSAFSNMNESLGTIIDILDTSKNIQNNLLTASHNG